ncbi:hypothetical protein CONLIGDRAFT_635328 [Coniochaeta ligniaria NRRL 30616]|uniref:Uncharacterized protein n=1 Tax=Coniochaeta ligniaria NRRL 30616 TaxID=1408157 RepID=A0A1J7IDY6_9PEZI|nr:hypothetical protein CONLIGDRAFT_635328 [Coniochaeta ligniaria NRRL 30616]
MNTTVPDNEASSGLYALNAFRLLDKARTDGDYIRTRLAYIRLIDVFDLLEKIVGSSRRNGRLPTGKKKSGYRNPCVVIDDYLDAQEQAGISRDEVKNRKRVARRWRTLAGPSPIFVIIYSGAAEGLAYVQLVVIYATLR